MTAKEMFEELGFELNTDNEFVRSYRIKHDENFSGEDPFNWDYINFYIKDKTYNVDIMIGDVDIKLHKAIHQQLKELGWLDD